MQPTLLSVGLQSPSLPSALNALSSFYFLPLPRSSGRLFCDPLEAVCTDSSSTWDTFSFHHWARAYARAWFWNNLCPMSSVSTLVWLCHGSYPSFLLAFAFLFWSPPAQLCLIWSYCFFWGWFWVCTELYLSMISSFPHWSLLPWLYLPSMYLWPPNLTFAA